MKWGKLLHIFWLIFPTSLLAQMTQDYTGSIATGMGGAALNAENIWAVRNNPAMLSALKKKEAAVDHGRIYANSGLSSTAVALVIPHQKANLGAFACQSGYSGYRYLQTGLSLGKKLSEKLDMGMQLSYASFDFGDRQYGSRHSLNSAIGAVIRLPKNIQMAVVVNNLHRPGISSTPANRETMSLKAAVSYATGKNTLFMADVIQPNGARAIFRLGMEYRYQEQFIFRAGLADNADFGQVSFGFGFKHKQLVWNSAALWHPLLGLTPQTGLHYVFP
jgi:hypothetical protein